MGILYHYTCFNALIGVLKKEHLCFWGSRYDSMNDPTEVIYARDIVLPALIDSLKGTDREWETKEVEDVYAYIVSFSKKEDDFNMWRLYNAEVALVINKNALFNAKIGTDDENNNVLPSQIVTVKEISYADDKDVAQVAVKLFNDSNDRHETNVETFCCEVFPFIKNEAYNIEEEVRMVCLDYTGATASYNNGAPLFVDTEMPRNVKCRGSRNGSILLYKEFWVKKEALQKIVVRTHDEIYFEKVKKQLRALLVSNGYKADLPIERTKSFKFIETKK